MRTAYRGNLTRWEAILGCTQRGWFTPKCTAAEPAELVARAQRAVGRHRPQHGDGTLRL